MFGRIICTTFTAVRLYNASLSDIWSVVHGPTRPRMTAQFWQFGTDLFRYKEQLSVRAICVTVVIECDAKMITFLQMVW